MKVRFLNSQGGALVGYLYKPFRKMRSALIFCHGFSGFKEVFRIWARYFSFRGFVTLAFDFTGNGESDGFFTDGTISQEISDINSAIQFLKKECGIEKVCVVGHSMGGTVALLSASKIKDINCVVALAPLAELQDKPYKKYANMMADIWDSKGLCEIVKCKKMRSLEMKFFYDLKNHDVLKSVKKIKVPILVVHGDADSVIDIKEGKAIYDNAKIREKYFYKVKGVDHYFSKGQWEVSKAVLAWCRKYLK